MLTISVGDWREMGLLKRVRLSPLPTWVMLAAIVVNALIISLLQVVVLFLIGRFGYHVGHSPQPRASGRGVARRGVCFTVLGIAVSTLIPNQEAAGPVTSIVFFILLFLSGLYFPIKSGSGLAQFAARLPRAPHDHLHRRPLPGQRGCPGVALGVARHPRHGDLGVAAPWVAAPTLELGAASQRSLPEGGLVLGQAERDAPLPRMRPGDGEEADQAEDAAPEVAQADPRGTAVQNPMEHGVDDVEVHVLRVRERGAHALVHVDERVDEHDGLEPVPGPDLHRAETRPLRSRYRPGR